MGTQLREALRCLCVEIGWSYAVFWRSIRSKSPMHLVWEAGHVVESRIEVLVNKIMAQQVHLVGEGLVGQAAATGIHQWIFVANFHANDSLAKDLAELNHQFLEGIQTITVIPVLGHGVLQLGCTQMVMENIGFVNHVKYLFAQLECATEVLLPDSSLEALVQNRQTCAAIPVTASELLPDKLTITTTSVPLPGTLQPSIHPVCEQNLYFNSQFESKPVEVQEILCNQDQRFVQPAFSYDSTSNFQDHSSLLTSGLSSSSLPLLKYDLHGTKAVQLVSQISHSKSSQWILEAPCLSYLSINNSASQKQKKGLFKACDVFCMESDVNGLCDGALLSTLEDCRLSNAFEQNQRSNEICDAAGSNISQSGLNIKDNDKPKFPHILSRQSDSGNDLYDILGCDYTLDCFGGSFGSFDNVLGNKNDSSANELAADNSACKAQMDVCSITCSVNDHISGDGMFTAADANQLLDAVVSKINSGAKQNSDDGCTASITNTCSSSVPVVTPLHTLIPSLEQLEGKPEILASMSAKPGSSLDNKTEDRFQSHGIFKSQIGLWVESGQSMNSDTLSGPHSKRVDEIGKPNRKRARPGENPRPRPKDRQMIMDRVKELREIIPNGAKCSIDALLEKTIKHMLFLQTVTKHADNLKDIGEPKFIDKEGRTLLKEKFEGGATWAFQVGSQSMTCPIIVEDLNPPRQLLVEMLCEHRGVFLEIADLIRGLGLTILKGVIEAHRDKIWARFAVEANRDVTRIEIFLSLVRLLESTVPQVVDNINILKNNMYHQSGISVTGTSNNPL